MLPKLSILSKAATTVVMITALLFLTTANFWAYGLKDGLLKQIYKVIKPATAKEYSIF